MHYEFICAQHASRDPYSMRMYNNLVEKCFTDCVDSFRRKDLDSTEEKVRVIESTAATPCLPYHPGSF